MQAAQLAIIGAHGYWNPVVWLFSESGYAKTQWWLTRITIEQFRLNWVLSELNKVKIEVDSKFGKDYSERCCENETKQ